MALMMRDSQMVTPRYFLPLRATFRLSFDAMLYFADDVATLSPLLRCLLSCCRRC